MAPKGPIQLGAWEARRINTELQQQESGPGASPEYAQHLRHHPSPNTLRYATTPTFADCIFTGRICPSGNVRSRTQTMLSLQSINAAPSRRGVALGPPNAMSRRPKIRWAASDCAPVDPDTGPHGPSGRTSHPDLVNHGGTVSPQLAKTHTLARPPKTWVQKNFTPDSA